MGYLPPGLGGVLLGRALHNQPISGSSGDEYPLVVCLKAPFRGLKNKLCDDRRFFGALKEIHENAVARNWKIF